MASIALEQLVQHAVIQLLPPSPESTVKNSLHLFVCLVNGDVSASLSQSILSDPNLKALAPTLEALMAASSPASADNKDEVQALFIEHHYMFVAKYVLRSDVLGRWWRTWSVEERKSTFGAFFGFNSGADVHPPKSLAISVFTALVESLSPGQGRNVDVDNSTLIVKIIERCLAVPGGLTTILKDSVGSYTRKIAWNRFLTLLVSYPDRIARISLSLSKSAASGNPKMHVKAILGALRRVDLCDAHEKDNNVSISRVAQLLERLCRLGYTENVASWIASPSKASGAVRVTPVLLSTIPEHTLRLIHESLYRQYSVIMGLASVPIADLASTSTSTTHIDKLQLLHSVVGSVKGDAETKKLMKTWEWVLCMRVNSCAVAKCVMLLSHHHSAVSCVAMVKSLAQRWKDPVFIHSVAQDQHIYVSQALLIGLHLIASDTNTNTDTHGVVVESVMSGVQERLSSPVNAVRHAGMIVGEKLSMLLGTSDNRLQFNEDYPQYLVLALDGVGDGDGDGATIGVTEKEKEKEKEEKKEEEEEADDDDTDSLFAYDISQSHSAKASTSSEETIPVPKHIRDLDEYLTANGEDRANRVHTALETAGRLIRGSPVGLSDVCVSLSSTMLRLTNEFGHARFDELQLDALAALIAQKPSIAGLYVAEQFTEPYYSLGQRELCLIALEKGAIELSTASQSTPVIMEMKVEVEDSSKTRRFHHTKPQVPNTRRNEWAPHATSLFHTLSRGVSVSDSNGKEVSESFAQVLNEPALLQRFIRTLAVIVDCGGTSLNLSALGSRPLPISLIELASMWRDHRSGGVRAAVLYAYAVAFQVVNTACFDSDVAPQEVSGWIEWLTTCNKNDSDARCRSLAAAALSTLANVLPGPGEV